MYIKLDKGRVPGTPKAMDFPGLDDKDVARAGFEFLSVDGPETPAFPHELDFVVRMPVGPGTTPWEGAEEEHGNIHVAVIGPRRRGMRAPTQRTTGMSNSHPGGFRLRSGTALREGRKR